MKETDKINRGFTLIEMLIAIFIIGVGLVGTLSFLNVNSANQTEAKNELIAAGLAQEGTELVRYLVDHSFADNPDDWYADVYADNANYCHGIDRDLLYDPDTAKCYKKIIKKVKDNAVCYDPAEAVYKQSDNGKTCAEIGLQATNFTRTVTISGYDSNGNSVIELNGGDCLNVLVSVTWHSRTTKAADVICKPRQ